ncbi:hypothetical protein HBI79_160450 [Parastagonospora nodorum]|nr:hypothetical protein HBI79_160450 [Parastagonospora nodorum]
MSFLESFQKATDDDVGNRLTVYLHAMLQQDHQWEDYSTIGLRAAQTAGKLKNGSLQQNASSGVKPAKVFLAQIQRRLGLVTVTLHPCIAGCWNFLTHGKRHHVMWLGQIFLVEALLALGHGTNAMDLLRADPAPSSWACEFCNQRKNLHEHFHAIQAGEAAGYCEVCMQMACAECTLLIHTDEYTRFCVSGHRMLEVTLGGPLVFRGVQMDSARYAEMLRGEFGIHEADEESQKEDEGNGEEDEEIKEEDPDWDKCSVTTACISLVNRRIVQGYKWT